MNSEMMAAFAKSMKDTASMMLDLSVTMGKPELRTQAQSTFDVSAIIGLSGDCVGSVALSLPLDTATALVSRFVGSPVCSDDPDFADGIGEITNMIAGSAKANFHGMNVSISCPSVIIGPGHRVFQQREVPIIEIPINCEVGSFVLMVSIRNAAQAQRAAG